MAYWLFKEEPTHYSFDQLVRDGETVWNGVINNLALIHLRKVRKGDEILFYHTGGETAMVGVMHATSDPYPDPTLKNPKLVVVDVRADKKLAKPVTLSHIKNDAQLSKFDLVRLPRLSVMPVPPEIWSKILKPAEKT
jgi:predicted RNA-binding protein with PUA-like domain